MKTFLSILACAVLSLTSFGQTQGVSMRATNGVAFGDTIVQYHVSATNLATTNTFRGNFQQGQGTVASGTGASALGLNTRSSGSYSISSGIGNLNAGPAAFVSGRSNTIGSSALGAFVSGNVNEANEPGVFISGFSNGAEGSNTFMFGTGNTSEGLTHNSFIGGQGIFASIGSSNNFVWNSDPAGFLLPVLRSNSFTVNAPGGIYLNGPIDINGSGLTNAGITNEIFSYNLSASAVAGATSVVLDRSLASVSSSAGRVYIGWNTTNMEIRPASTVSGATVSFSVPLVFNHASGQRVVYSQSSESFPLATGTVPGNDSGWEMLQLLKTSGDNAVIANGVGQTISSTIPFVVPNSTHLRNVKLNAISGFPLGNTNVYMYMSRQDERYAFTANAATDVITVPGGWNPPVSASNATVVFYDLGAGTLPQPLSNGVPYFVVTNSATALTVKGNIGDSAAINLTTSGSGFMDSEAGSLVKTYLEDVYLDGGVQPNINGLWANIQQQSYLNNVRIANVATGLRLMGQQADWNNLEIGPCGIGIDMRAGPLDQNGAQFMYFKTLNIEQFTTNAIVLGGNNNVFIGTHLEGGTSTTAPVIDGSQSPSYSMFENLVVGSMSGTNDIFRMGTSGGFAASYDIRNVNVTAATPDGPMWLLNDLYRNIRIPAYSSTNGVPDRFVGRIFAPPIPSSLDFPSIFGGETWVSQAGRYFTGPQQHQNEPLLMAQAGTNDTGPLFTFRRSDGSSNVNIYGYGLVMKSNSAPNSVMVGDATGLAGWSTNLTVGGNLTVNGDINFNGDLNVENMFIDSASSGVLGVASNGQIMGTNNLYGMTLVSPDYSTNLAAVSAAPVPNFAIDYSIISTNADFAFSSTVSNLTSGKVETSVILVTNAAKGSLMTVTIPSPIKLQGTANVTNNGITVFTFMHYGNRLTNCVALPLF